MFNFKKEFNLYKIIFLFVIGSFLGCLIETIWCFLKNGYFENRQGLIYGPFIPIYGIAFVLCSIFLYKLSSKNSLFIFIISAFSGGVFEYTCSIAQEKMTSTISWDYTNTSLSINGRTSIYYCIFWGIIGLVFIKFLYPKFNKFFKYFSHKSIKFITFLTILFMIPNIILSTLAIRREVFRRKNIAPKNSIDIFLDEYYPSSKIKEIFPNMIFLT